MPARNKTSTPGSDTSTPPDRTARFRSRPRRGDARSRPDPWTGRAPRPPRRPADCLGKQTHMADTKQAHHEKVALFRRMCPAIDSTRSSFAHWTVRSPSTRLNIVFYWPAPSGSTPVRRSAQRTPCDQASLVDRNRDTRDDSMKSRAESIAGRCGAFMDAGPGPGKPHEAAAAPAGRRHRGIPAGPCAESVICPPHRVGRLVGQPARPGPVRGSPASCRPRIGATRSQCRCAPPGERADPPSYGQV